MAIVFVNRYFHPDHAATAQMLADLAFHAAACNDEVVVVTSRQRIDDPRARLPARERVHGVEVHRVWSTRFGRARLAGRGVDYLSFHLGALRALLGLLRAGDTVVAATDPPLLGVSAALAARRRRARLVHWLHDVFPEAAAALGIPGTRGLPGRALGRLRDASLRAAAASVVLGERMARHVAALGVAPERIHVIHNWSDGEQVRPLAPAHNALRAELGLGQQVVAGYAGNLGRAHDLGALPHAARRLSDLADLEFLLIGAGAGLEALRAAVRSAGLGNVRFAPVQPRSRLGETLGAPDIHLLGLRPELEGLIVPSKLYGILAAGRCCVHLGDPHGEVGRILTDARCGLTVRPHDVDGLERALRRLHGDAALRADMGRRARALFLARYDRPAAMERWMRVL